MTTPPRAVLFDADGVLQQTTPTWRDGVVESVGAAAIERHPALLDELTRTESTKTLTGASDLPGALTAVLERYDVELTADDVLHAWHAIELYPRVLDGVRRLRERDDLVLALTTNQNAPRAAWMRAHLGFDELFDASFYSCEIGLAKPDPDYFRHVLATLDVDAADALFIDDTAVNVDSAAGLGLRAELFDRGAGRPELDRILARHGLA